MELGEAVVAVAQELKVSLLAFGSTDLTHYGPNYGWAPKGRGPEAVKWVKEVNDKRFIDAGPETGRPRHAEGRPGRPERLQRRRGRGRGGRRQKLGARKAVLNDYYTSYDVMPGDSFVGYAGIVLEG